MTEVRLTVTLGGETEVALPVHYNHHVQAMIYRQIRQPALRDFLHQHGFALGGRRFKLFTFSRLLGRPRLHRAFQQLIFRPPIHLVICSPVPVVLQEIANGLLREGRVRVAEASLEVREVKVRDNVVRNREVVVRMLSPLVTYSTVPVGGGSYTYYYSPFEPRFRELVLANLAKKYLLVFGRPADETGFEITPKRVGPADLKIVNYKDTVIKGWMGTYRLTGDPQLLEMALSAGLGAKNSQGFGCCELRGE